MHETKEWYRRGMRCLAYYEGDDRYILCVYTPQHLPCSIRANCKDIEAAQEMTNIFADDIADLLDPLN